MAELIIQTIHVWSHEQWLKVKFLVEVFEWNLCLGHISLSLEDQ